MNSILSFIKKVLSIPHESKNVAQWKVIFLWFIRVFVFVVATLTIISGNREMGLMTFIVAFAITIPVIITKGRIKDFPIEIDIMLFLLIFIQYVLGEIGRLYYTLPYFDKFAHFSMMFLIAAIFYTIIFAMYEIGRFQASRMTIFILIILTTMGIGGIWEIVEYGLDFLRRNYFTNWVVFQGSLVEDPYYDTMNDLLSDFLGGIFGAIFTLRFIFTDIKNSRTKELIHDIRKEILE